ncbi:uncharacterized protein LOC111380661 isoform X2 [Olea europaea subsp. europaea]|uniref:Uncharacterized protein LOC111380661 isoform X2 n=1 Tax=Olea europaea subsp. europaea TaxID=158383 RepID=A0A8S0TVX0_OLEEU|nr:uncharacterized protein LOC111380661 isoform X2 [Olea europaea subsp. europaea]
MATSLAATFAWYAPMIPRSGLAGAADHYGPPKVDFWKDPMSPFKRKEEHFVNVSLSGRGLLFFGGYKFFTGGKKKNEKLVLHNSVAVEEGNDGMAVDDER